MKPILALDGALGFSCALLVDDALAVRSLAAQSALELGLSAVDDLLREAGLRLTDLGGIALGLGPGSFTGLRIALSYGKALALGAALPACGVSSYDILEPADAPLPVLTVISGRPGVVCARLRLPGGVALRKCGKTADVVAEIAPSVPGDLAVVGVGEEVIPALQAHGIAVRAFRQRDPVAAAALIRIAAERGFGDDARALAPDYGEAPATTAPKRPA